MKMQQRLRRRQSRTTCSSLYRAMPPNIASQVTPLARPGSRVDSGYFLRGKPLSDHGTCASGAPEGWRWAAIDRILPGIVLLERRFKAQKQTIIMPPNSTRNELMRALERLAPNSPQETLMCLADILSDVIHSTITPEVAKQKIQQNHELLSVINALAGKELPISSTLISFGSNSQIGDVSISNLAGGNIVNFNISVSSQAQLLKSEEASRTIVDLLNRFFKASTNAVLHPKQIIEPPTTQSATELLLKALFYTLTITPILTIAATFQGLAQNPSITPNALQVIPVFFSIWFIICCVIHFTVTKIFHRKGSFAGLVINVYLRTPLIYLSASFMTLFITISIEVFTTPHNTYNSKIIEFLLNSPLNIYVFFQFILFAIYIFPVILGIYIDQSGD